MWTKSLVGSVREATDQCFTLLISLFPPTSVLSEKEKKKIEAQSSSHSLHLTSAKPPLGVGSSIPKSSGALGRISGSRRQGRVEPVSAKRGKQFCLPKDFDLGL